ncbi:hypothetical protein [uncultured Methanobrevibacter sp.]|uniref:hypothetical protein n=1 Tax=uncultured Methanobrevibacter sp. TaxID=253161 RepID=UPI0025FDCAD2|nr:hypothetical protein [uncultured Methanobrevibacter sp.]MBR4590163.1 hypothetical protein [Bacteroidaceae bacterium]
MELFDIILKDYNIQISVKRDEKSDVYLTWYNIVDGKKIFIRESCEEQVPYKQFMKFKNAMRCFNQVIENNKT